MKNKLTDLNNHLFAQLERLGDESLVGDKLIEEINRAKAIANIAQQITNNGNLALNTVRTKAEFLPDKDKKALPEFFADMDSPSEDKTKKIPDKLKDRLGYE